MNEHVLQSQECTFPTNTPVKTKNQVDLVHCTSTSTLDPVAISEISFSTPKKIKVSSRVYML